VRRQRLEWGALPTLSSRFSGRWRCEVPQHISEALELQSCSTQITQGYSHDPGVKGPAGNIWFDVWFPWIAMSRREPVHNCVAYTSGFDKIF
jgi:hypothetical protein